MVCVHSSVDFDCVVLIGTGRRKIATGGGGGGEGDAVGGGLAAYRLRYG